MRKITLFLSTFLMFLGTMNANAAIGNVIPRTGWSVSVSSSCDDGSGGHAQHLFDGNHGTYWHSNWGGGNATGDASGNNFAEIPEYFIVDLGAVKSIGGFGYQGRNNDGAINKDNMNGGLKDYKIFVSSEPFSTIAAPATNAEKTAALALENPVATGTLEWIGTEQFIATSSKVEGRYVLVLFASSYGPQNGFANCDEFNVYAFSTVDKSEIGGKVVAAQNAADAASKITGANEDLNNIVKTFVDGPLASAQAVASNDEATAEMVQNAISTLEQEAAEFEEALNGWLTTSIATPFMPGKRVSTLEAGKQYLIYDTAIPDGQNRTGFLSSPSSTAGKFGHSNAITPAGFVLNSNQHLGYIWTLEAVDGEEGVYKLKNYDGKYVTIGGICTETPAKLTITEWTKSQCANKAVGSLTEDNVTVVANADIAAEHKVWTINEGGTCWNGNQGSFDTWTDAHPYAFYEIEEAKYPVNLHASGIDGVGNLATFSAPIATAVPTGATAYFAKVDGDVVRLTALEAGKAIPANAGVILESTSTELVMVPTTTEAADATANEFKNTASAPKTAASIENGYVLADYNSVASFCKLASGVLPAYKAYIEVAAAEPAAVRLVFGDKATGIESATVAQDANAPVYDLSGRQVKATKSGIYVSKGKKFIVK